MAGRRPFPCQFSCSPSLCWSHWCRWTLDIYQHQPIRCRCRARGSVSHKNLWDSCFSLLFKRLQSAVEVKLRRRLNKLAMSCRGEKGLFLNTKKTHVVAGVEHPRVDRNKKCIYRVREMSCIHKMLYFSLLMRTLCRSRFFLHFNSLSVVWKKTEKQH